MAGTSKLSAFISRRSQNKTRRTVSSGVCSDSRHALLFLTRVGYFGVNIPSPKFCRCPVYGDGGSPNHAYAATSVALTLASPVSRRYIRPPRLELATSADGENTDMRKSRHAAEPTRFMTVAEAAKYLQLHRSTLYKLIRHHQIPAFKIGSSDYRLERAAIVKWKTSGQVKG